MDQLKQGMSFIQLKEKFGIINQSDFDDDYLVICWSILRKIIYKLSPNTNYMKIKEELEWCNGHENDRSYLDIEWGELEEILKKFKVVK